MKNKTLALWLTLFGGPLGVHRLYLRGRYDAWSAVLTAATLTGLYGVYRARSLGVDDQLSWLLIPFLGFTLAGCALNAIVYGLMSCESWNARFNPTAPAESPQGDTGKLTVAGLVTALFLGTTVLMASLAFSFQRYFEYQIEATKNPEMTVKNSRRLSQWAGAATKALAGMVNIQAHTILPATPQRTALARRVEPTPTIAPVMVCLVNTGTPNAAAKIKVMEPPVSAQNPPTGINLVIRCPIIFTMRHPPNIVPRPIAA